MDAAFGELVARLRERDLYDPAAVVFLSDHGESLGEHDYWFEHGWFAFESTLRIPLWIKAPGQRAGRDASGPASLLDVAPTLLRLAGSTPPRGTGRDLLNDPPGEAPLVVANASTYPERYAGLRTPAWKYLRRIRPLDPREAVAPRAEEELYDLATDPRETRNLAADQPERVASLRRELERRLPEVARRPPGSPLSLARQIERLRVPRRVEAEAWRARGGGSQPAGASAPGSGRRSRPARRCVSRTCGGRSWGGTSSTPCASHSSGRSGSSSRPTGKPTTRSR
jgi:arylsulfatase A-like enzyme